MNIFSSSHNSHITNILTDIYGQEASEEMEKRIQKIIKKYKKNSTILQKSHKRKGLPFFSEKDAVLITYANSIESTTEKPLKTLKKFLKKYVQKEFSIVHILPFFPSSSDGGFSIKDFRKVDEKHGNWSDISAISQDYRVMADLVLNHVSVQSEWFQKFLKGDKKYKDFFLHYSEKIDTSAVFRSRIHPLLTKFQTRTGEKYVWTTFSPDQVDLNYQNPEVLYEIIDILFFYLSQGVEILRLDAVGFLWKNPQTSSIHLPQTHNIVKLLHVLLEEVAPYATLVTETNVQYQENISYFGKGNDESHAVYAFDLPPLIVHAFFKKTTSYLQNFYHECKKGSGVFLNFLASHDGIGLLGAKNIVPDEEIEELVAEILCNREGFVSKKSIADENHPYELNVSFFDALNKIYEESIEANQKFLAAHAISIFLQGIPAVYIHSLLGSRNNYEEARRKGIKRLINRARINWEELQENLAEPSSRRLQILNGIMNLLSFRKSHTCFSPEAKQNILIHNPRLFCFERGENENKTILIVNVSNEKIKIDEYKNHTNILQGKTFSGHIKPYQTLLLHIS